MEKEWIYELHIHRANQSSIRRQYISLTEVLNVIQVLDDLDIQFSFSKIDATVHDSTDVGKRYLSINEYREKQAL